MKRLYTTLFGTLIISLGFAPVTLAQDAHVTAEVLDELSITTDEQVSFGTIAPDSEPVLDPTDQNHSGLLGTEDYQVGEFTITGSGDAEVTVSYDASHTLAHSADDTETINFNVDLAGHEDTQASAVNIPSNGQVTLSSTGSFKLWLGGNLGTLTDQQAGSYSTANTGGSGPVTITIEYN